MSNEHPAVVTLRAFIEAMHAWEIACGNRGRERPKTEEEQHARFRAGIEELGAIFARYTTAVGEPPRGVQYQRPPEYDVANEEIVNVTVLGDDRVEVSTRQRKGFKLSLVYVLRKVTDGWKVDSRWQVNGDKRKRLDF